MQHRWRTIVVSVAVVAAACGGSGSDDADPGDGVAAATTEPTSTTLDLPGPASFERAPSAIYQRDHESFPPPLIDITELRSPGPGPDGIRPIDDPVYIAVDDVDFLLPQSAVMVVELNDDVRAFPAQVMIWHEIVNTEIGGVPVTVSYCPLCNSAVAYDRRHPDGTVMDFGTSGLLHNSALVMYDRQTATLWTHLDGVAVHGVLAGNRLDLVPVSTVSFAEFSDAHPDGLVLSRDTGMQRSYGANPYPAYDGGSGLLHPATYDDTLAAAKDRVVALRGDESVAVRHDLLFEERVVDVELDGRPIVVWLQPGTASPIQDGLVAFGSDIGSTGAFLNVVDGRSLTFTPDPDGGFVDEETGSHWNVLGRADAGELDGTRLEPVEHLDTFWFAINSVRPDTVLVSE